MQINISVRHGHLSDATQQKIAEKVEKLLRYFDRITAIEVTIDVEHEDRPMVELRVNAEHKHDFVAHDDSGEMMASVERVVHKVQQQLKRYKEKIQKHRSGGLKNESPDEATGEYTSADEHEEDTQEYV